MRKTKIVSICIIVFGVMLQSGVYAGETEDYVTNLILHDFEKYEEFCKEGIPEAYIFLPGEEVVSDDFEASFTIMDYNFVNNINEIETDWLFDYDHIKNFVDEDGALRPYIRQMCERDWETNEVSIIEEKQVERAFLKVDVLVRGVGDHTCLVPLNGNIIYTDKTEDGNKTWISPRRWFQPTEETEIIVYDNMCIGSSAPGQEISSGKNINPNEEYQYSMIFIVDEDKKSDFLLELGALYNDINNGEMCIKGYFDLENADSKY